MLERNLINRKGNIIILIFGAIGLIFTLRAAQVQILDHDRFEKFAESQQQSAMSLKARRGAIMDCKGIQLAYDLEAKSYSVNPRYMKNQADGATKLERLTGKSREYWIKKFQDSPGFLTVARKINLKAAPAFENSHIETLKSRPDNIRMYPFGELVDEIVGKIDPDGRGISGLELYYDSLLAGIDGKFVYLKDAQGKEVTAWEHTLEPPQDGSNISLALDIDYQQIVEFEMTKMLDSSGAKSGWAVFMDIETGGILACVTVESDEKGFARCRSIVDMNEPGSTAKLMPLVAVFRENLFEPHDIIDVEGGKYKLGKHVIHDDHPHDFLRCDEIGIYSSNIGAAKMGLKAGAKTIYNTLSDFGFGKKTGIDFPGEAPGLMYKPEKWSNHFLANVCFGYGISVTALQLARAYGVIASDGELLKPYFAQKLITSQGTDRILNSRTVVKKILDSRTIEIMQSILRKVVLMGTAKKAFDKECPVSGKTGTARKTITGGKGYDSQRFLASFVGYFPTTNPQIVGAVMFDEPHLSGYGGDISAPVLGNIASRYASLPGNDLLVDADVDSLLEYEYNSLKGLPGARVVNYVVEKALESNESPEIVYPAGTLPSMKGYTIRDAVRILKNIGLDCSIAGSGIIESQTPDPGTPLDSIAQVILVAQEN